MGNGVGQKRLVLGRISYISVLMASAFSAFPSGAEIASPSAQQAVKNLNAKVPAMNTAAVLSTAGITECQNKTALNATAGIGGGGDFASLLNRDPESLSCSDVKDSKTFLDQIAAGKQALTAVGDALSCASAASSTLMKALEGYRGTLDQTLTQAGTQLQQANQYMQDLKAKADFTDKEVLPDLIQAKKDLEDFQRTIDANVVTVNTAQKNLKNKKLFAEQQKRAMQMAEAMKCFKNNVSSGQCFVNGVKKAVSAYEHALCITEGRTAAISGGGSATRSVTRNEGGALQSGAAARASIQAVLDEMLGNSPTIEQVNASLSSASNSSQPFTGVSNYGNLTPADLQRNYENRLRAFDVGGANTSKFIIGQIQYCYNQAANKIENASSQMSNGFAQLDNAITIEENSLKAANQAKFKEAQMLYERVSSATSRFTSGGRSLDIAACSESTVDGQLSCLQKIRTEMGGLLNGNTAASVNTLRIQGTNPATAQMMNCSGVTACINVLRKFRTDLATEVAGSQQKIDTFKNQLTANLKSQIKQEATKVNAFSLAIQNQVKSVSRMLAGLGISTAPRFKAGDNSQITVGEDGMPQLPGDIGALMGSMAQPPLQDLDEASLDRVRSEVGKKLAAVQNLEVAAKAKADQCSGDEKKALRSLARQASFCLQDKASLCESKDWDQFAGLMTSVVEKYGATNLGSAIGLPNRLNTGTKCPDRDDAAMGDAVLSALLRKKEVLESGGPKTQECEDAAIVGLKNDNAQVLRRTQCSDKASKLADVEKEIAVRNNEIKFEKKNSLGLGVGESDKEVLSCSQVPSVLSAKLDAAGAGKGAEDSAGALVK